MPIDPVSPTRWRRTRLGVLALRLLYVLPAIALSGVLLAGSAPTRLSAAPEAASYQLELRPTERQRKVARLVSDVISKQHYRQAVVDDQLSSQVFDRYVESLDGNRSYLLASDVAELERYRYQLADAVRNGVLRN